MRRGAVAPLNIGANSRHVYRTTAPMIGLRDDTGSAPPPVSHAPALAAKIFAEGGWLQDLLRLEHRPQQEAMARAVASAVADDAPLPFEAGTGGGNAPAHPFPGTTPPVSQSRPWTL